MMTIQRKYNECAVVNRNKDATIKTFLHYSDPNADKQLTVFGHARKDLFYNYDDRLVGNKWYEGLEIAIKETGIKRSSQHTARFFEIALSYFHNTPVDLQHIILGCNQSNGYSYLVFGYTY